MPSLPPATNPLTATNTSANLSPNIISALSPSPYLQACLTSNIPTRPSGRSPTHFRQTAITTSSLTHALGSAVVRQGDTAVVCGITPEILLASEIADPPRQQSRRRKDASREMIEGRLAEVEVMASLGLLVPNIDLSTGCSPANLPGLPPTIATQALSQRLYRLLLSSSLVQLYDLEIWRPRHDFNGRKATQDEDEEDLHEEIVAYYTLHINLTVLSLAGTASLASTAFLALLAALRDLRLPMAKWDDEREMVICSDVTSQAYGLNLRGTPVMSSFGVFTSVTPVNKGKEKWVLADPDGFEEGACREWVDVVVDCSGGDTEVLRIEKNGGVSVSLKDMRELVGMAEVRWKEVAALLPAARASG